MEISYPKLDSDWVTTTYGASYNDNIRFPHGTIFYATRSDGSMRFAYVRNGKLYDAMGNEAESNGMSLITSLVDVNKRKVTWTCGQLKVVLPDSKAHVDSDYYRTNFKIRA
ncbi:hypothetical protein RUK22_003377 [Vibrio cholerae]|uniref:hypothetical protein n=1 Tax=Vibrio cholerae TaxID=666 RepID=UPI0028DA2B7F|nr:hypothetical protein [Vibrio cholerae]ELJ8451466.1 hypothetical protein [Vibrio cholerae]ELY5209088.1 hypothetical protein [Vibrio cholerae]MDV2358678.1 hypothetical protein [Vibrio cholerae]